MSENKTIRNRIYVSHLHVAFHYKHNAILLQVN
jgi:hypothetical protein